MNLTTSSVGIPLEKVKLLGFQAAIIIAAIGIGRLLHALLMRILGDLRNISWTGFIQDLLPKIENPSRWLFLWCSLEITLNFLSIGEPWATRLHHLLYVAIIICIGWVLTAATIAGSGWLNKRYSWSDTEDNVRNRSINTQLRVFTHVIVFIIWILTAITIIMTMPHLRSIGVSLFASAGVAGIVIGMAATPTLSNLIAGIQLALTQPVRIGDQITIDTASGIVEEIDSTYVVVRMWDLRRLIVPLNYFIQNRFQNWTHISSKSAIAMIDFYVDYTISVDALRKEMEKMVKDLKHWDGKTCSLQVIDVRESKMIELRASVSTNGAVHVYPLQCELREKILLFVQHSLPKPV